MQKQRNQYTSLLKRNQNLQSHNETHTYNLHTYYKQQNQKNKIKISLKEVTKHLLLEKNTFVVSWPTLKAHHTFSSFKTPPTSLY